MTTTEYTYFGTLNGHRETPELVKRCQEAGHITTEEQTGNHLYRIECHECRYVYKYDSS